MKLVGLLSTYREGSLAQLAARALIEACDHVLVLDAPFGQVPPEGDPTDLGKLAQGGRLTMRRQEAPYADDAAKRTAVVEWACQRFKDRPLWGLWLDGDETLLWPEHVRPWLAGAPENAGGLPLPLVELSGAQVLAHSRLIRIDVIERYVLGSYQIKIRNQLTEVSLPNMPAPPPPELAEITRLLEAAEFDFRTGSAQLAQAFRELVQLAQRTPVVAGTPQILHLSPVRKGARAEHRVHVAEQDWIEKVTRDMGLDPAALGIKS